MTAKPCGSAKRRQREMRRRSSIWRSCTRTAGAFPRTTEKRCAGTARRPSKDTRARSPIWESCTTKAGVFPRTTGKRCAGTARLPSRDTRMRSSRWDSGTTAAGGCRAGTRGCIASNATKRLAIAVTIPRARDPQPGRSGLAACQHRVLPVNNASGSASNTSLSRFPLRYTTTLPLRKALRTCRGLGRPCVENGVAIGRTSGTPHPSSSRRAQRIRRTIHGTS